MKGINYLSLGKVVRQRRKAMNVSQGMVCEGLCTAMTLSRFESGQQTPSWDCTVAILQRLGLPDDQICAQLTREETQLELLRKEVHAFCGRFEQAQGEEQEQVRIQALEKLRDFERTIKKDDHINQQFILRMQVTLGTYSPQEQLEMLMEAIRLTSPRFDLDELSRCLYSTDEMAIINKIAIRYYRCEQRGKAIDIYSQLLQLVQKRSPNHKYLSLIAYNYARYLAKEQRLEEALEISELGRQICVRQGYYYLLPYFLHVEAECCYLMGETGRSAELYRSAYHIYGALANTGDQEILEYAAEKHLNLVF